MNKAILAILIFFVGSSLCMAQPEKYPFQRGDGDLVSGLSWSPRNDLILTASGDENALRLWDVGTGRVLWKSDVGFLQDDLELYSIRHAAWTSDQRLIVTGTDNGKLQLWDSASGRLSWNTRAHAGNVTAVAISPNGIWSLFPIDQQELDAKKAAEARRLASIKRDKENARLADIENEPYKDKIYITFDHYGDMTPLGEQRIAESDTPNKSNVKKSAADATAIWLRLHNDSPLPVSVPTQSMYLPNRKCFHEFPDGQKLFGLCDKRQISVWLGLEDRDGKPLQYGFDFGSSVILLPGNSVLFAVPHEILRNGNAIRFSFTFQKSTEGKKIENYGTDKILKFRESDLPKG